MLLYKKTVAHDFRYDPRPSYIQLTHCSGKIRTGSDKHINKKRKRKKVPPPYAPHSLANKEMKAESVKLKLD